MSMRFHGARSISFPMASRTSSLWIQIFQRSLRCGGQIGLLTFGLLSPNKGIENVIRALPAILARHPNVVYVVSGVTHPHIRRSDGESYREGLLALAEKLGVGPNLILVNRFVSAEELVEHVGAADIYITPYRKRRRLYPERSQSLWEQGRRSSLLPIGTQRNCWRITRRDCARSRIPMHR
jgi:glycosyltransferase involved in cell wall biosynthesis